MAVDAYTIGPTTHPPSHQVKALSSFVVLIKPFVPLCSRVPVRWNWGRCIITLCTDSLVLIAATRSTTNTCTMCPNVRHMMAEIWRHARGWRVRYPTSSFLLVRNVAPPSLGYLGVDIYLGKVSRLIMLYSELCSEKNGPATRLR